MDWKRLLLKKKISSWLPSGYKFKTFLALKLFGTAPLASASVQFNLYIGENKNNVGYFFMIENRSIESINDAVEGKVFKYKTSTKWLCWLSSPLFIYGGIWSCSYALTELYKKSQATETDLFLLIPLFIGLFCLALGILAFWAPIRFSLRHSEDGFQLRGIFKNKSVSFDSVDGYFDSGTSFSLLDKDGRTILDMPSYLENYEDLRLYCCVKFHEKELARNNALINIQLQNKGANVNDEDWLEQNERVKKHIYHLEMFSYVVLFIAAAYFYTANEIVRWITFFGILMLPIYSYFYSFKKRRFLDHLNQFPKIENMGFSISSCIMVCWLAANGINENIQYIESLPWMISALLGLFVGYIGSSRAYFSNMLRVKANRTILLSFKAFVILSAWAWSNGVLSHLNAYFDPNERSWVEAQVVSKQKNGSSRVDRIIVIDEKSRKLTKNRFFVDQKVWNDISTGDAVELEYGKGLFGYSYVNRIRKVN